MIFEQHLGQLLLIRLAAEWLRTRTHENQHRRHGRLEAEQANEGVRGGACQARQAAPGRPRGPGAIQCPPQAGCGSYTARLCPAAPSQSLCGGGSGGQSESPQRPPEKHAEMRLARTSALHDWVFNLERQPGLVPGVPNLPAVHCHRLVHVALVLPSANRLGGASGQFRRRGTSLRVGVGGGGDWPQGGAH